MDPRPRERDTRLSLFRALWGITTLLVCSQAVGSSAKGGGVMLVRETNLADGSQTSRNLEVFSVQTVTRGLFWHRVGK